MFYFTYWSCSFWSWLPHSVSAKVVAYNNWTTTKTLINFKFIVPKDLRDNEQLEPYHTQLLFFMLYFDEKRVFDWRFTDKGLILSYDSNQFLLCNIANGSLMYISFILISLFGFEALWWEKQYIPPLVGSAIRTCCWYLLVDRAGWIPLQLYSVHSNYRSSPSSLLATIDVIRNINPRSH